jgi:hypothetical protein
LITVLKSCLGDVGKLGKVGGRQKAEKMPGMQGRDQFQIPRVMFAVCRLPFAVSRLPIAGLNIPLWHNNPF